MDALLRIGGLALLSALSSGCGGLCSTIYVYGLDVQVVDEAGTKICDAEVTAIAGAYREMLTADTLVCTYRGAGERAGTYRIEVRRAGYRDATIETLVVEDSDCHVKPVTATVTLTR